jgi:hypothetical protein
MPHAKNTKSDQIYSSVTCGSTMPVNDRLVPSAHGADESGDTLMWDGILLNQQKLFLLVKSFTLQ